MDKEIKRLLRLSNIPAFRLLDEEKTKLEAWKKAQKRVQPKRRKAKTKPATTTNSVKPEEKEIGALES